MKKIIFSIVIVIFVIISCFGCSKENSNNTWTFNTTLPANCNDVVRIDALICTGTQKLYIQNQSNLDITVYLYDSSDNNSNTPLRDIEIKAGGAGILYQLSNLAPYSIGVHGFALEETKINLMLSDEVKSDPYLNSSLPHQGYLTNQIP